MNDNPESSAKFLAALPHSNFDTLWQPLVPLDAQQRNSSLEVVLPRLAHVHVFHWLSGDPIDRRALLEGADFWRSWLATMRAAGRQLYVLLEFARGDEPSKLAAHADVLSGLLDEAGED